MSLVTAKFVQTVTFEYKEIIEPQTYKFEVDNLTFGFEQIGEQFTFLNDDEQVVNRGWRFVMGFQSRYMRKADSTTADFTQLLNDAYLPIGDTRVRIEGIDMPLITINFPIENRSIQVRRQRLIPSFDFTVRAISKATVLPSWFRFVKDSPGYLTI